MMFSKNIKKSALSFYKKRRAFYIRKNKDHKIIWHFCTPKSASTYLTVLIKTIINRSLVTSNKKQAMRPRSYFVERQQEPITEQIFLKHYLTPGKKYTFMGHTHTHFSDFLDVEILSEQHRVICQTRPLLDTLASFYDHVEKFHNDEQNLSPDASSMPMMKCRREEWNQLSKKERYDMLIQYYVPWHIDFLVSWLINNKHYKIIFVQYENLILNTVDEIKKILDYCEIENDETVIEDVVNEFASNSNGMIRKNKGISYRGKQELTADQQARIKEMINLRADYFHKNTGIDLHSFM